MDQPVVCNHEWVRLVDWVRRDDSYGWHRVECQQCHLIFKVNREVAANE